MRHKNLPSSWGFIRSWLSHKTPGERGSTSWTSILMDTVPADLEPLPGPRAIHSWAGRDFLIAFLYFFYKTYFGAFVEVPGMTEKAASKEERATGSRLGMLCKRSQSWRWFAAQTPSTPENVSDLLSTAPIGFEVLTSHKIKCIAVQVIPLIFPPLLTLMASTKHFVWLNKFE